MVKFFKDIQKINKVDLSTSQKHTNQYRKTKKRVELLCSEEEHKLLLSSALKHHQKLSPFILNCAFAYLKKGFILPDDSQVKRLEEALRRHGNNLNQLAYHANKNNSVSGNQLNAAIQIINRLENEIKELFFSPISIEDEILNQARNNPGLIKRLLYTLIEMDR